MTRYLSVLCAMLGLLLIGSGCSVIHSHTTTKHYGKQISDETLARIEVGRTTLDWLVATLGEPTSRREVDDATTILKYASKRISNSSATLLFVFDTSSKSEEKKILFFEFHDGILHSYWEETHSSSRG